MARNPEFQRKLEAIEELIGRIEVADPALQAVARELVELVMELHGTGLDRVLEMLRAGGEPGEQWIDKLGRDDLVSSLLVLHGLHPQTINVRVERAIDTVRPSLRKRGAEIELVSFEGGIPRLRLRANGHAASLKELVEDAVYQAAPDITSLIIEGAGDRDGFVPLDSLLGAAAGNGFRKGGL